MARAFLGLIFMLIPYCFLVSSWMRRSSRRVCRYCSRVWRIFSMSACTMPDSVNWETGRDPAWPGQRPQCMVQADMERCARPASNAQTLRKRREIQLRKPRSNKDEHGHRHPQGLVSCSRPPPPPDGRHPPLWTSSMAHMYTPVDSTCTRTKSKSFPVREILH